METTGLASLDHENPKVRQLLEAAQRLFIDLPYDAVSTDAIAREAKVSKATLYVYFPSKEKLFATLVSVRCSQIAGHFWQEPRELGCVETELRRIARNFIAMLATPEALGFYRSIVSQATRFPELGRAFYEAGPKRSQGQIAAFLTEATRRGHLDVPDPALGAMQFIQLVTADIPMKGLLAIEPIRSGDYEATIEAGIALFMAGYGPRGTGPSAAS